MVIKINQIEYTAIPQPNIEAAPEPVNLTEETMKEHRRKILNRMRQEEMDILVIYADREHGANFGYLTGFEPRFEEAVLVLRSNGTASMLLGNEGLRMAAFSGIPVQPIHVPAFSLPNQPMERGISVQNAFEKAGIRKGMKTGLVGWKMFTGRSESNSRLYDIPHYIVEALFRANGTQETIINATGFLIDPEFGVRTTMNANEIAHYEYGASNASNCVMKMLENVRVGAREIDLAEHLAVHGQPINVQTICAAGERFTGAIVAPRARQVKQGDKFTTTMGLRGGLTNRSGYVAASAEELPPENKDYIEKVVKPYYAAAASWYATIGVGITGGELYQTVQEAAPREIYGWVLNPGHLTAGEEWMSSPIEEESNIRLKSGMMLQMDIILNIPGYGSSNAEDGIVLADEKLRRELEQQYPDVWGRMQRRRAYMQEILGIPLKAEVLPMAGSEGYLRPFLLNCEKAMCIRN